MSLILAITCSIIGLIVGIIITLTATGDYKTFPIFSALAGFSASYVIWKFFVEKNQNYGVTRGIFLGIVIAIISHHLTFYYFILFANIEYWILNIRNPDNMPPLNPFSGLFVVSIGTLWSLIFYGWITLPIGAFVGWVFTKYKT
ncbi:hypothetical protein LEP1GSC020_2118 [Leptospira interrogans serovar Grippotyphosa str. 2006006986]|nr:hypothetical protein LEP1GSC045_0838 [Leptospira interrogans serovar Pomona str. Kennewicki LC82-25]EKN97097.1 hypothetical protein LEP1GSC014_3610 [Leptospira interrogans serovar Pomona str. Pomona]EKO86432.1 hypothetical protein LEP1GSC009_4508 [Leptospira interrogans serovar Grippotyphosa str. Andaman]EKP85304.1 hypothetical protein LEP1GSC020_2118 [Leptospira interrogans serovar Grippotyphosa str. 2006006986]EKR35853.1 hypothetical protein LEP1GSC096_4284 [Leptospira interrogans serovar 